MKNQIQDGKNQANGITALQEDPSALQVPGQTGVAGQTDKPSNENRTSYLVPLKISGHTLPLFCIHCATGDVLRYRDLAALLGSNQIVYGLRAPQIDPSKTLPTVEDLAKLYVTDIRRAQEVGPYQLCGLSIGGILAFEVASQLRALGEQVSLLALFDTGNPAYYRERPFLEWCRYRTVYFSDRIYKYMRRIVRAEMKTFYSDLRKFLLWHIRKLKWVFDRLREPIKQSDHIDRDSIITFTKIGWRYTPKPYEGNLYLFRAEGRRAEDDLNSSLGWNRIVKSNLVVLNIPGTHDSLLDKPDVGVLAEKLQSCLDDVNRNNPSLN